MALNIQDNADLLELNTMRVPARARFLAQANTVADLQEAIDFVSEHQLPLCVLGQGSNTLFVEDFDGLLVLNQLTGMEIVNETNSSVVVKVSAGENWHDFVDYTLAQGWYGLENLALIPGLVGAAPIQNIGAYGVELQDSLVCLEYLDTQNGQLIEIQREQCQLTYRDSIFKRDLVNKVIITTITLELSKVHQPQLKYPALIEKLAESGISDRPTARQIFEAVCSIRSSKLPDPKLIPNTGSFFKNPLVSRAKLQSLTQLYPQIISFPVSNLTGDTQYKLAAAWLIECAGWKNKSIAGVEVHQLQALVIINPNGASGASVYDFAKAVQADIQLKFGVKLEIEPRMFGRDGPLANN